jgi:hypothetical protein
MGRILLADSSLLDRGLPSTNPSNNFLVANLSTLILVSFVYYIAGEIP